MIETVAIVESNRQLSRGYRLLILDFQMDLMVRPGQFAMLKAHSSLEPVLRRALAVYRVHGPRRLSFLYQVVGRGTEALSQLAPGGEVEALLPLGNSWPIDASFDKRALVVAGGIGSASVLMLCEELRAARADAHVFLGAASEAAMVGCGVNDFRTLEIPLSITTDDGSLGERGFVTVPLERHLRDIEGNACTIYACGPWVMMKRVAEIAASFEVRCIVSLEAPMGCGFGVCVGCVVAMKSAGQAGYDSYRRVCTDGPIFDSAIIRWEVNAMH
ncbi:MAG TPA: dihydroorotate dehydrogenase electron transfer subunit [Blastocatellia bacterium]|nr:dihydroorotate dehydrogenase electron transfer subunit [Blastocatellia bacterium]